MVLDGFGVAMSMKSITSHKMSLEPHTKILILTSKNDCRTPGFECRGIGFLYGHAGKISILVGLFGSLWICLKIKHGTP